MSSSSSVDDAKNVLGAVWDSVVDGVHTVAHKAVETLQQGVGIAENAGHTVVEGVLGAKDTVVEKTTEALLSTGELIETKATLLSESAKAKTAGIRQTAEEYLEAGKEKAALLSKQAAEKTESVKEAVGGLIEAGKQKFAPTSLSDQVEEVERVAASEASESLTRNKRKAQTQATPETTEAEELLAQTHGDEVDVTGHIVVAPENVKEGKRSDYVGGWQQVGKDGHHTGGAAIIGTSAE